jgi:hypothetical protein
VSKSIKDRISVVGDDDLVWKFENGNNRTGYYLKTPNSSWGHTVYVDPFPCYSLDPALVLEVARQVEETFPVPFKPYYFILSHEADDRCNGMATTASYYPPDYDTPLPFDPIIVLSGKRIPIHPAMQRYLVAHEYGHVIDYNINYMMKTDIDGLDADYAKMRGIDLSKHRSNGARKWHTNIGEILVNDFRVACAGIEPEFWPHTTVKHPNSSPKVRKYWQRLKDKYGKDYFPIWTKKK